MFVLFVKASLDERKEWGPMKDYFNLKIDSVIENVKKIEAIILEEQKRYLRRKEKKERDQRSFGELFSKKTPQVCEVNNLIYFTN